MKVINLKQFSSKPELSGYFLEKVKIEMEILKQMNHTYVTKLYEIMDPIFEGFHHQIFFVLEFCSKGTLERLIYNKALRANLVKKYSWHIIQGLYYVHETAHVIHRDIKPANILIANNDLAKLSDFGAGY